MRLRMLFGVLVLSLAVSSCGLIKEKGSDEEGSGEKAEEKADDEGEKKADDEAADEAAAASQKATEAAEAAKKAADELAKKAADERAALEAEKSKLIEEKKAAEEAAAQAEAEKLEAEKKHVIESVGALSEGYTKTKMELRSNLEAWEAEGVPEKVQALSTFLTEYEKVEAEVGGIKAYLMQDDLEKAKTGMETLKGTWEALEKQAAVLLADKPQPMDGATRAKLLGLIAEESCLQKAVPAGKLTDADLPVSRSELLTAAGMSAEQYDKLRAKLARQPEPTDATVLEALMGKACPDIDEPPATSGEAYWKMACEHAMGLMKAQMGGDLPQAEMDKIMVEVSKECLGDLQKVDPAIADKASACVLAATAVEALDACDPAKIGGTAQPVEPVEEEEAQPVEEEEAQPVEEEEAQPVEEEEAQPVEPVEEEEAEPVEEIKPKAPAISKNMKFAGPIKGKGKTHTMTLHKKSNKLSGTVWHPGGKVPMSGSFTKSGATFSGKKGKDRLTCSGKFKGSRLQGKCSGTLGKGFSGKFNLKGKRK